MADNKTKATSASVDAFIADIAHPVRRADAETLLAIMGEETGLEPRMWGPSIVGFGRYHYIYASGHEGDAFRIGFSPRKQNMVVYVMPGFASYQSLLQRLGKHKVGKSCLYINKLGDIDLNVLRELIAHAFAHMNEQYPPNSPNTQ